MFDIVGDIHSCYEEFILLLNKLGYEKSNNIYVHPTRKLISVGDIFDRGPYPLETFQLIKKMVDAGSMMMVCGNHDHKIHRWAKGNNVLLNHGADKTVAHLEYVKQDIVNFFNTIPFYLRFDNLIIVHAAFKNSLLNYSTMAPECKHYCLHGPTTGKFNDAGLPIRIDWTKDYNGEYKIVYGHYNYLEPLVINNTYGIDTSCVFGNKLTALRYPEMEFVSINALKTYYERKLK